MAQWYWAGSGLGDSNFGDVNTSTGWNPHQNIYGSPITVGMDGTATAIAMRIAGNANFKFGLYNSSLELVAQGSVAHNDVPTWVQIAISAAVTAAGSPYYIFGSADNTNVEYWGSNTGNGRSKACLYADAMPDPITSPDTETGYLFGAKVYVEEAAGAMVSRLVNATPLKSFVNGGLLRASLADICRYGWRGQPVLTTGALVAQGG